MKSTTGKKKADKLKKSEQTGTQAAFENNHSPNSREQGVVVNLTGNDESATDLASVLEDERREELRRLSENILDDGKIEAPKRRMRKVAEPNGMVELSDDLMQSPLKMQYALLLALLLRSKGTAKFSAKDLETVDSDYNIVFARTLDGRSLEVTVVSSTSGILKSPEHGNAEAAWTQQGAADRLGAIGGYGPPPAPNLQPGPETLGSLDAEIDSLLTKEKSYAEQGLRLPSNLAIHLQNLQAQRLEAEVALGAAYLGPRKVPTKVQEIPVRAPAVEQPKDGSRPYQFPFETGNSPATAQPVDLTAMSRTLLLKDNQIAEEQAQAIERQQQQES
jgi:hypothetical protein